ncbi:LysE family translocator [Rapidithrix thailandica]|uniref:LysE family translocator n=1 Tax=Rapidithrix thailandica TaxID=413964 RepID=A0AAW9RW77_9BACT
MQFLEITNFYEFLLAGIVLIITPGADTMYIIGRSIAQGKRAGIYSVLGISSGILVHTIFASLGLSVILAKSALAFMIVKYLGAAYLIYLGIKMLAQGGGKDVLAESIAPDKASYQKIYFSGMLTNVLNPKVALFFLAFLPQFVAPSISDPMLPFLFLGTVFTLTATVWTLSLALFAAAFSKKIIRNPAIQTWLNKISGSVFILLGVKLAFTQRD